MEDAITAVSYATRSPTRVRLLSILEDGPFTIAELSDRVDASSRTVRRAIDGLREDGWVKGTTGGYELTRVGRRFAEELLEVLDLTETLVDLRDFFELLPEDEFDLEIAALEDASVTVGTAYEPYAPVERVQTLIEGAETILTLAPIAAPFFTDPYYEQIVSADPHVETVLRPEVLETLQEKHGDAMDEVLRKETVSVYAYENELSFGLIVLDDRVAIGAYDDTRSLRALVVSDSPQVYAWGRSVFESYRADATPVATAGEHHDR